MKNCGFKGKLKKTNTDITLLTFIIDFLNFFTLSHAVNQCTFRSVRLRLIQVSFWNIAVDFI